MQVQPPNKSAPNPAAERAVEISKKTGEIAPQLALSSAMLEISFKAHCDAMLEFSRLTLEFLDGSDPKDDTEERALLRALGDGIARSVSTTVEHVEKIPAFADQKPAPTQLFRP